MTKNAKHISHGHGHQGSGGSASSHIPDGHLHDHSQYRDLNFRAIVQFIIGLVAIVAVSYISMYGMLKLFESNHEQNTPPLSPVAVDGWNNPGPEVQVSPHVDLTHYVEKVDSSLQGETPNSMPIEEAMKSVVSEGLPYRVMTAEDSAKATAAMPTTTTEAPAAAETQAEPDTTSTN